MTRQAFVSLALVVALAHLADLLTFLQVAKVAGIEGEANFIIRWVFGLGGFWAVIGFKITVVALWVAFFQAWAHRGFSYFFAGVGVFGALINTLSLFLHLGA